MCLDWIRVYQVAIVSWWVRLLTPSVCFRITEFCCFPSDDGLQVHEQGSEFCAYGWFLVGQSSCWPWCKQVCMSQGKFWRGGPVFELIFIFEAVFIFEVVFIFESVLILRSSSFFFFHQRSFSIKGGLPSKVIFNQRLSSIKGCLPLAFHCA